MAFLQTTAINKLLKLTSRKKIIQGGTWSGKTYGIIACQINNAITHPNRTITVVAETIPAIKRGALSNFKEIMYDSNRWNEDNYNGTDRIYTFSNGSTIEFNSFDSVGKAKASGKRTDLFINECYYINYEIVITLMSRTSGNIWFDYNPVESFWIHDDILTEKGVDFIILRPEDNEALPDTIKQEHVRAREKARTSSYWANWCRVYLDGEIGNIEGLIYTDWQIVRKWPECNWVCYGLDFGFSNDPTALIKIGMSQGEIYLEEMIYQTGLTNQDIAEKMRYLEINRSDEIYADSAEPKSIEEIYRMGFNIKPATKGQDSIKQGIDVVSRYKINIMDSSTNLLREVRGYKWQEDMNGKRLNKPVKYNDHAMDAKRYGMVMKLGKPKTRIKASA